MDSDIQTQIHEHLLKDKGSFLKKRGTVFLEDGKLVFPEQKFFEEDLNFQFTFDKTKYLGEFRCEYYHLSRKYIETPCKRRNLRLYYTSGKPFGEIKANFLLIHGFGEHSSRYMDLLDYLAVNGYWVHMIDLSGFGQSGGSRGHSTMSELQNDIEIMIKLMDPNFPLFLLGHSMGGGLVSSLMIRNPGLNIAGVITSSALFGFPNDRSFPWLLRMIFKNSGPLLDDVVVNSYINGSALSKNNYHIKKMIEDRFVNPFLSMKAAKSIFVMLEFIVPHAHRLHYPLLVLHGKNDIITSAADSVKFFNRAGSADKTLKIIPHAYHEPMHDLENSEYKRHILDFLELRYSRAPKLGLIKNEMVKGFPSHLMRNTIFVLTVIILIKLIKKMQLFTNVLPVRHIMMRIFKHTV